jgi:CRISPR/Cas system CMR-associated protein Cmr5 small subunit
MDDPGCDYWKRTYNEMHTAYADRWPLMTKANGDKRFARWYKSRNSRPDLTVVTAVNPDYLGKLQNNFKLWMADKELSNQHYLIFVNRMRTTDKRLKFLNKHNVTLVKWRWPVAGDNVRERMLSAFVYGVAEHVKTPYWMKLDADATPKKAWEWPDYDNHVITGHRCGYTVSKKGNEPGHFLNLLDQHAGQQVFPEDIKVKRYRHKRLASYCWFERTDFTRRLADWCGDRLPVPSHDTTACYYAQHVLGYRIGDEMRRMNMKEYMQP